MLTAIPNLPAGVIGFESSGKLEATDYRDTLAPALQKAADEGGIRMVLVMPAFEGIEPKAIWEDASVGIKNWSAWKRSRTNSPRPPTRLISHRCSYPF